MIRDFLPVFSQNSLLFFLQIGTLALEKITSKFFHDAQCADIITETTIISVISNLTYSILIYLYNKKAKKGYVNVMSRYWTSL